MIATAPRPVQKQTPKPVPSSKPKPWNCTVEEFHDLGENNFFEGRRCFLITGIILDEGMMNHPQATAGTMSEEELRQCFGAGFYLSVEKPLVLGRTTDPKPDAAVIRGNPREATGHPTTAELVLEIADTSLQNDLTVKAPLYAAAAIPEYWVLDLENRRLIVHRDPDVETGTYSSVVTHHEGGRCSPLIKPDSFVNIADMLPAVERAE
jgi:Uma2 family endonuclease